MKSLWLGSRINTACKRVGVLTASIAVAFSSQIHAEVDVFATMTEELNRSFEILKDAEVPVYFLSYEITNIEQFNASASQGSLIRNGVSTNNYLDIDLRVGTPSLDNTHPVSGRGTGMVMPAFDNPYIPISINGADALKQVLWHQTNKKYRSAVEQFRNIKIEVQVQVKEEDTSGDFSFAPEEKAMEDAVALEYDSGDIERKLELYSSPFAQTKVVQISSVVFRGTVETRYYVNTEGTTIRVSEPRYYLSINASTRAADGMVLPRYETWLASSLSNLPSDDEVLATVTQMIDDLAALRDAPLVEPYEGPAILSGRASGVFFHEILGHRLEAHRMKSADDSQTFKKMLGEKVLPESFSVVFDPTMPDYDGVDLAGTYRYDNQGVKARSVRVIENGTLKQFLMSRTPVEGFLESNGHGRKSFGNAATSRQSNLFVEVSDALTLDDLKAQLVSMLKESDKPFGLLFDDIQGGFTFTGRQIPNAFNVTPVMVYKIYPDGTQELVRGVDLVGTPLTSFSSIVSGGGKMEVFNGTCGAESGPVPVSAVSPAILVSKVEVQKKEVNREGLPILPHPPTIEGIGDASYLPELAR